MSDKDSVLKQTLAELRDVNKDKRRMAVMKLGMIGGDTAVRNLMMTVENTSEDLIVRGRAAMMLGKLRDPRAVDPLIRALNAPGFQTPLNAAYALGLLGDDRAIVPLLAMATHTSGKLQETALGALKQLGYEFNGELTPES